MKAAAALRRRWAGYLLVGAAACLWGSSVALARAVFSGRLLHLGFALDPLALTQARVTISALLLAPVIAFWYRGRARIGRNALLVAAALGVAGMSGSNLLYYVAVARTNIPTAVLLQYTAPVWVLLWEIAHGREHNSWTRWAGVGLALGGIGLLLPVRSPGLRFDTVGVGCALGAAFTYAFYNLAGRKLAAEVDPLVSSAYMLVAAAVVLNLARPSAALWTAARTPGRMEFLVVFAVWATLAPTLLYLSGLRYLEPTRAVITGGLEPVSGIVMSAVWLGEGLGWAQAAGAGCVFGAIWLIQRS